MQTCNTPRLSPVPCACRRRPARMWGQSQRAGDLRPAPGIALRGTGTVHRFGCTGRQAGQRPGTDLRCRCGRFRTGQRQRDRAPYGPPALRKPLPSLPRIAVPVRLFLGVSAGFVTKATQSLRPKRSPPRLPMPGLRLVISITSSWLRCNAALRRPWPRRSASPGQSRPALKMVWVMPARHSRFSFSAHTLTLASPGAEDPAGRLRAGRRCARP